MTISERPLAVNQLMVPPVHSGLKTMTRRLVKPANQVDNLKEIFEHSPDYMHSLSPFGKPGDLLWVREDHKLDYSEPMKCFFVQFRHGEVLRVYEEDINPEVAEKLHNRKTLNTDRFVAGRYLPKALARIWLMVTDLRVERLTNISETDAILEGIEKDEAGYFLNYCNIPGLSSADGVECLTAVGSFSTLWAQLHGAQSWDANPGVWVVTFRQLSTTGKPDQKTIDHHYKEVTNG